MRESRGFVQSIYASIYAQTRYSHSQYTPPRRDGASRRRHRLVLGGRRSRAYGRERRGAEGGEGRRPPPGRGDGGEGRRVAADDPRRGLWHGVEPGHLARVAPTPAASLLERPQPIRQGSLL